VSPARKRHQWSDPDLRSPTRRSVTRGGVVGVEREGELDWGLSCGNEEQREHDSDSQRLMTQGILVTSYPFLD
jgi:hypothetical protein